MARLPLTSRAITNAGRIGTPPDRREERERITREVSIAVGEETGRLEAMLESVAETYESTARRGLRNFLTVLEPAVILGMGLMVGFIVFSMFLAIFQMNEVPF
jgi:hypothetical protein